MACQSILLNTSYRPLAVIANPCIFNLEKYFAPADEKRWLIFIINLWQRPKILFLVCSWPLLIQIPHFKALSPCWLFLLTPWTRKGRTEVWESELDTDFPDQCKNEWEGRRDLNIKSACVRLPYCELHPSICWDVPQCTS